MQEQITLEKLHNKASKSFGTYYEPFIGGGAMLFDLQPDKAVISDVNEQLINTYIQIQKNTEARPMTTYI